MDRWQDADDDITPLQHGKGRVARMGIAGFVQAAGEGILLQRMLRECFLNRGGAC